MQSFKTAPSEHQSGPNLITDKSLRILKNAKTKFSCHFCCVISKFTGRFLTNLDITKKLIKIQAGIHNRELDLLYNDEESFWQKFLAETQNAPTKSRK